MLRLSESGLAHLIISQFIHFPENFIFPYSQMKCQGVYVPQCPVLLPAYGHLGSFRFLPITVRNNGYFLRNFFLFQNILK